MRYSEGIDFLVVMAWKSLTKPVMKRLPEYVASANLDVNLMRLMSLPEREAMLMSPTSCSPCSSTRRMSLTPMSPTMSSPLILVKLAWVLRLSLETFRLSKLRAWRSAYPRFA